MTPSGQKLIKHENVEDLRDYQRNFKGVRYFSTGIFTRATSQVATSQMCNFPNVQFPKGQLPKG